MQMRQQMSVLPFRICVTVSYLIPLVTLWMARKLGDRQTSRRCSPPLAIQSIGTDQIDTDPISTDPIGTDRFGLVCPDMRQ
jgi:hypothetical protein